MSRSTRRIDLTAGYVLHHRPYRDTSRILEVLTREHTSRILEVLTREHGRLTLFARAVRGPAARLAPLLQPFEPLLLSWSGRGEAPQLTGAERMQACPPLPPERLLAGFYLNELIIRLTTRHDPLPELFDRYHGTLGALRSRAPLEPALRVFEKRLLEALGYAVDLAAEAHTARRIEPEGYYHFRAGHGLTAAAADSPGALAGRSILDLARESLGSPRALEDARRLLKAALEACLEGRPLATPVVARSMMRKAAR